MLKVVIDTNQFISSVINKHGPSANLLEAWRKYCFTLILSDKILQEIRRVFFYPRISQKYHLEEDDITAFLGFIEHEAVVLSDLGKIDVIKDDPEDNEILACALEAGADYIVSGDKHLLNLKDYHGIAIVTVQEFLKLIAYS